MSAQDLSTNLPQPKTFAPSREDVLSTLGFFFGDPAVPEKLKVPFAFSNIFYTHPSCHLRYSRTHSGTFLLHCRTIRSITPCTHPAANAPCVVVPLCTVSKSLPVNVLVFLLDRSKLAAVRH